MVEVEVMNMINKLAIEGIEVKSPTLEDVFLHLTGRELRE